MKIKEILKLLSILRVTGQAHQEIDTPLQGSEFLLGII